MSILTFTPASPGRKLDLLAFQTDTPFIPTIQRQTIFNGKGGAGCTGWQKMTQQFLLRLYTRLGGKPYSDEGTQFVNEILAGTIRTTDDARRAFAFAKDTVIEQFDIAAINDPTIPLDEQLDNVELLGAGVQGDELFLTIRLTSRAGIQGRFIAPLIVST